MSASHKRSVEILLEAPGADIFSSPDMPFSDDPAALDLSVGAAIG